MLDFLMISSKTTKKDTIEIKPKFILPHGKSSSDLMIRGGDFYAIWNEETSLWSTNEGIASYLIDKELTKFVEEHKEALKDSNVHVMYMWDSDSGSIDRWHKYVQKQSRDSFHPLDETLVFSNTELKKEMYASKRLPYALIKGECPAYDELMSTLYFPEERKKIEWAIGAIVCGDSKILQKFLVIYGSAGTGKSTVLNIIKKLFEGYDCAFDAKALGDSRNSFALEPFRSNPLVAIQHDGDLSKIEDNTRLNSLVSHEMMIANEKYTKLYPTAYHCFLFMGTNSPVKITDAKSGIIRRLIDVSPSGKRLSPSRYKEIVNKIEFELGAIAWKCREVYLSDPSAYDNYIPVTMLSASNDFYNFILDSYSVFDQQNGTTLKAAWEMYKTYCDDAKVVYPYNKRNFKEELKNYFRTFEERAWTEDRTRVLNWYSGFMFDKFQVVDDAPDTQDKWLKFNASESIFDKVCADCPAQLATTDDRERPLEPWDNCTTTLIDIDTSKLHYVRVPENHIVIDFDLKDESGQKSYERNYEAALKWPETYAELSKSGKGIHLHYIYEGDPTMLSREYAEDIEVKVFTGKSSLRRKLTKCNKLPIAPINSGLPLKENKKVVDIGAARSEAELRRRIMKNINKKVHDNTSESINFIYKILEDAYNSGLKYNVTDMEKVISDFASSSSNQSDRCRKLVLKMKLKSDDADDILPEVIDQPDSTGDVVYTFFDLEVYPNYFCIGWAYDDDEEAHIIEYPTPAEIENFLKMNLIGFNCRRYDNHILYAKFNGYTVEMLYNLSQRIISGDQSAFFPNAYDLSYTDIYDFSSKKQSLKKFEIELGIHHMEMDIPWDQPVPEEMKPKVAEYCKNDVLATRAVFHARKADFIAREILADVAGMKVNDTTNSLTTRIIFGSNRSPQDQFKYRNLGDTRPNDYWSPDTKGHMVDIDYTKFLAPNKPVFPGYRFEYGRSFYRGEEVGEGGYVYAEPGMYFNVVTFDVASMHPSSIIAENLFGDNYTARFKELLDARIAIKHKDYERAKKMLNGVLAKYLDDESMAIFSACESALAILSQALKIAINSVYGLTAARFSNPFRDPRNVDNIVAKRGALFMINLKNEVQRKGYTVCHIKTDSIKIVDPSPEIVDFIMMYGDIYGYTFEVEHKFDRICLVNDAVYIAKCAADDPESPGAWTATGTQFAVPYVFKKLFSHEPIEFEDMCETKSTTSSLYLDMNENLPIDEHLYRFVGKVGQFCPIKKGCGGGDLFREKDGKYYAVGGTKGYKWLESENVRILGKEADIDRGYYATLVDEAISTISKFGDFEQFTA